MISVGEWRELEVPGHEGVGDGAAVPDHVQHPGPGEGGGQEAGLGHQEWLLGAHQLSRGAVTRDNLEYEGGHGLESGESLGASLRRSVPCQ